MVNETLDIIVNAVLGTIVNVSLVVAAVVGVQLVLNMLFGKTRRDDD